MPRYMNVTLLVLCLLGLMVIPLYPVNSGLSRLSLLAALVGCWLFSLMLVWNFRRIRALLILMPMLLVLVYFMMPSRNIDSQVLRTSYINNLKLLEETRYVWGGESTTGIDCSGLPRLALRDALFSYGIHYRNRNALQQFMEQWWFDASASALGAGYRDDTFPVGLSGRISELDFSQLREGDMAVTGDGVHVVVFLGDSHWIQAEPGIGKVITLDASIDENPWFNVLVNIYRWRLLE